MREIQPPASGASPVAGLITAVTSPWGERTWLRVYCVGIGMAFFLSFIGALGTNAFPIATRIGYWLVLMLGGTAIVQMISLVVDRFVRLDPLPEAIAMFAGASPVITLFVWAVSTTFTGDTLDIRQMPGHLPPVLVITAVMSALHYALNRDPKQSHVFAQSAAVDAPAKIPGEALRERLPFKYRQAEIHALSAEDHYLRVHTSAGDTLILMRLYDAIRELDGIEGSQTHRSWWVAKSAVRDIRRGDGKMTFAIAGEVTVPVSRSYAKSLKDAGWF